MSQMPGVTARHRSPFNVLQELAYSEVYTQGEKQECSRQVSTMYLFCYLLSYVS